MRKGNARAEPESTESCVTLEEFVFGRLSELENDGQSKNLGRLELTPVEEKYFIGRFVLSVGLIKAARKLEESLEENIYFPESVQEKMGFIFDFQEMKKWKKRHIKWQAAAQILWVEDREASVETIKHKLLSPKLFELLELEILPSLSTPPNTYEQKVPFFRNLGDVISAVKPRNDCCFACIPMVYDKTGNKLHGQALYIAITTMAKVLKNLGRSIEDIMYHEIFCLYALSEPLYPIIYSWITSSLRD